MRGPKPKAAHMHLIEGTSKATLHTGMEDPATGDLTLLEPPPDLTPEGRVIWREVTSVMPEELLRLVDVDTLKLYVHHSLVRRRAQEEMDKPNAPLVIKTKTGSYMTNPYLSILNKQTLMLIKLCEQLGLNPVARARIFFMSPVGKKQRDPVEKRYFG